MKNLHTQPAFDIDNKFLWQSNNPEGNKEADISSEEAAKEKEAADMARARETVKSVRDFAEKNPDKAITFIPGLHELKAQTEALVAEGKLKAKAPLLADDGARKLYTNANKFPSREEQYASFAEKNDAPSLDQFKKDTVAMNIKKEEEQARVLVEARNNRRRRRT